MKFCHNHILLRELSTNNGPRLLWLRCECRVKNAMRGQSRGGRYRGEFYYEYKADFIAVLCRSRGKSLLLSEYKFLEKGSGC